MSTENYDLPFPEAENGVHIPLVFSKTDTYTKDEITKDAVNVMSTILDSGNHDPLSIYARMKTIQEFITVCMSELKEPAIDELTKHGKGGATIFGMPIITKESGKKLSYEHNSNWTDLDDKIKELTDQRKELEKMMKGAIGTAGLIDDETGEIIEPAQTISEGKTVIQVTIPKK